MFRRRIGVFERPRLLGAALVGGLGFAAGRASKGSPTAEPAGQPAAATDLTAKLKELADLHASGALTDEEFAAAKSRLIGS
ncbi:MAG: SHOCT domain-containing protein [Candidatus Limnocylindrales bacterium]|jgi:hypothetical protein